MNDSRVNIYECDIALHSIWIALYPVSQASQGLMAANCNHSWHQATRSGIEQKCFVDRKPINRGTACAWMELK